MTSLKQRLRAIEKMPKTTNRDAVLILPENGTETPGLVRTAWQHFCATLRCAAGSVLIIPRGEQLGTGIK